MGTPGRPAVASSVMLRSLAGGVLFGEVWGMSPPSVVALHGWKRTHVDFSAVLGPAAPGGALPSVAPDLPGFGATPAPSEAWGSAEYAEAVARLIQDTDGPAGPVVVVGHSLGGRVAATLAAKRPDLVKALVLTGAPLFPRTGFRSRTPAAFRVMRTLGRAGLASEERMERARQRYGSADYRSAEGVMREILVRLVNETYDEVLGVLRCPVELVWGEADSDAPLSVAERISDRLPQAVLTVCRGAGHLIPLECPAELRAAVERAMART
jgi:pimeloyl-ACP methyl ester carboxylesterase